LEEMIILEWATQRDASDSRARYLLGNFLFDRRRYAEAIQMWEASAALQPDFATVWRNLGIAYFNAQRDATRACEAFEHAWKANPTDGRVFYERDQLWKRVGIAPNKRLAEMTAHNHLVACRDDLAVELSALYQLVNRYQDSLYLLRSRVFQPWEGGEGLVLTQHVRAHVALGRIALLEADPIAARQHFEAALRTPENLGEAKHPLANYANVHYWLGMAFNESGLEKAAVECWRRAASNVQDFKEMRVQAHSEMSYYRAMALRSLDQNEEACALLEDLRDYADSLSKIQPKIDYFATSLPAMLLFEEDLDHKNQLVSQFLFAQAAVGLGKQDEGVELLKSILRVDPNHALAADFLVEIEVSAALHTGSANAR
jgi:tetratricopeptide (TPR) repeat protein